MSFKLREDTQKKVFLVVEPLRGGWGINPDYHYDRKNGGKIDIIRGGGGEE